MTAATDRFDDVMRQITELGEYTPEYHDALAMVLTVMARRQWLIAERMRQSLADSAKRRARADARKAAQDA